MACLCSWDISPLYSFLVEFIFDSKIAKVDVNPTCQTKSHWEAETPWFKVRNLMANSWRLWHKKEMAKKDFGLITKCFHDFEIRHDYIITFFCNLWLILALKCSVHHSLTYLAFLHMALFTLWCMNDWELNILIWLLFCVNDKLNGFMLFILESKKHKEKNWEENDFYDSDEDTFLDRTGSGW